MKFEVKEIIYLNSKEIDKKEDLFDDFTQANSYVKEKVNKYINSILDCKEVEKFIVEYNDLCYNINDTYIDDNISYNEKIELTIKEI